ncbi:MAG: ATP synthase subunit I [Acidobacteria bacterium]|nr:ATP synthase subunit I [Acidobacteriota bacterium]
MTASPERALARIGRIMLALAAAGSLALLLWRGWTWCAGWLVGCTASILNYRWLRGVTESLGTANPRQRKAVLLGLRYLLLGGGAYVILKYSAISLPAALAGLFVPVAAVVIEILIELTYARN